MNLKEEIIIGFADPISDKQQDTSDDFPSLLGGEPVWLNQNSCPDSVQCSLCKADMTFLLQLYAPLEIEHAYHRVLHVFFCKNKSCQNRQESIKILRTQQKESDKITNYKSDKFAKNILEKAYKISTDCVEQKETLALEKEYMKIAQPFEVDDKEFQQTNKKGAPKENYEKENQLIKQFAQMAMEDPDFGQKFDKLVAESYEDDEDDDDDSDSCFDKFCYVLQKQDYHILRYCRAKETTPLWYSDKKQWTSVPKCKNCNKNLVFEFQLNSSILNHFPSMIEYDWGVIAFYTCENSCKSKESIIQEHTEIQVILEKEQVEDNFRKHMKMVNETNAEEEDDDDDSQDEKGQEEEEVKNDEKQIIEQSKDHKLKEKQQDQEEQEIPCHNDSQTTAQSEAEKPKQKKNKKKKAKQEKQEQETEKEELDEGEDW
ncbi:hypothetical protein ABPG74_006139 [Tetrahymena malaccensis]